MSPDVLIPLVAFAAMDVVIVYVLWRLLVTGGDLRRASERYHAGVDVARRADACLADVEAATSDLRNRRVDPAQLAPFLLKASDALRILDGEAQDLANRDRSAALLGLVEEVERARRAVELIEYGRASLAGGREGQSEGDTAIKRGNLNLLHARESLQRWAQTASRQSVSGR